MYRSAKKLLCSFRQNIEKIGLLGKASFVVQHLKKSWAVSLCNSGACSVVYVSKLIPKSMEKLFY